MSTLRCGLRCLGEFRAAAAKKHYQLPTTAAATIPVRTALATGQAHARRALATTPQRRQDMQFDNTFHKEPPQGMPFDNAMYRTEEEDPFAAMLRGAEDGEGEGDEANILPIYARPMPASPSYFSRNVTFNDSYVLVQDLARKYARLPVVAHGQAERVAWKTTEQYRLAVGETVKNRDYAVCMKLVKQLHQIHPDVMPEEVVEGIRPFKRDINIYLNTPKPIPVDKFGRAHGVGRRKASVARAWVVEGVGEVLVNGKQLNDAFARVHDRESALWGLKSMNRLDKYNVWALVEGGGTTGQAEALAMAVAKAVIVHEPALKTPLRKAGCITRDSRTVERKKTGHLKARKSPAWVKR